jgi:hypothetical protein
MECGEPAPIAAAPSPELAETRPSPPVTLSEPVAPPPAPALRANPPPARRPRRAGPIVVLAATAAIVVATVVVVIFLLRLPAPHPGQEPVGEQSASPESTAGTQNPVPLAQADVDAEPSPSAEGTGGTGLAPTPSGAELGAEVATAGDALRAVAEPSLSRQKPLAHSSAAPISKPATYAAVLRTKGQVAFAVEPGTAEIYIDGALIGRAQSWRAGDSDKVHRFTRPGAHTVRLTCPGYRTAWLRVIVSEYAPQRKITIDTRLLAERSR